MDNHELRLQLEKKLTKPSSIETLATRVSNELLMLLRTEGENLALYGFTEENLKRLTGEIEAKLQASIAKSQEPLRISLIGQFNAGKTSTLCALLNRPSLLRTSKEPTTGNVVDIQVMPPDQEDVPEQMRCLLFSQLELEEMLRGYYDWLRAQDKIPLSDLPGNTGFLRADTKRLRAEVRSLLRQRLVDAQSESTDVTAGSLRNLGYLYWVLMTVEQYFTRFSDRADVDLEDEAELFLPYNLTQSNTAQWVDAVSVLEAKPSRENLHPDTIDEQVMARWQLIPDDFGRFAEACEAGSIQPDALRALFPLYRRITLPEKMALPGGWGAHQRLSFMDFPGYDSGNWRDRYLCLQELKTTHANILFLRADIPKDTHLDQLRGLITEAKERSIALQDRLLLAINFFDAFPSEVQARPEHDAPAQAVQRVDTFFTSDKIGGHGFAVFDPNLFSFLGLQDKWEYHLLTPMAAMDENQLPDDEHDIYWRYKARLLPKYVQLLHDLQDAKGELNRQRRESDNPAEIQNKIERNRRLEFALQAYLENGGISYLRETISNKLRNKGEHLIADEARQPLMAALETLNQEIVVALGWEDLSSEAQETIDEVENQQRHTEIRTLWNQLEELTRIWSQLGTQVKLEVRSESSNGNYVSPLSLCTKAVLRRVLSDPFWERFDVHNPPSAATPLAELVDVYRTMENDLTHWRTTMVQSAIRQTLEKIEHTLIELELGQRASFQTLADEIFMHGTPNGATHPDLENLRNLFNLQDECETLSRKLDELWQAQELREQEALATHDNTKVPFNEKGVLTWSPVEIMKLQRQLILTLQRQISNPVAFYASIFFDEFSESLKKRLYWSRDVEARSLNQWFEQFSQADGIFEQLARVHPAPEPDAAEIGPSLRQQQEKAKETAQKFLDLWQELIVNQS